MATLLVIFAALALADPAPAAPAAEAPTPYDMATGCSAYHIFLAAQSAPGTAEAKAGEDKATLFLLAAYAEQGSSTAQQTEAKIESGVEGLFAGLASPDSARHQQAVADLNRTCLNFEPTAIAIVEKAAYPGESK